MLFGLIPAFSSAVYLSCIVKPLSQCVHIQVGFMFFLLINDTTMHATKIPTWIVVMRAGLMFICDENFQFYVGQVPMLVYSKVLVLFNIHAFFLFFRIRYPPFTDKNVQTGKWLLVPKIKNESSYFTYIILLVCIVVAVISLVLQVSDE